MQFFKAAILLVSSIGFKVALGCEPSFDPGCIEKLPFGNANSRSQQHAATMRGSLESVAPLAF
ncbi:hypothetical protein PGTUg99_026602 [Puccinia graminis f. sp. tritici]|uniref:Uncharacterized protein n=1 Tax=Puccinia graminis f. sp. tritici TaxID=56615 RepID=A0A5B0Q3Z3_PUCGR|nr:hypothetical protein PGTUg99_026602 [Puccinia graminis f. sp. tritici]